MWLFALLFVYLKHKFWTGISARSFPGHPYAPCEAYSHCFAYAETKVDRFRI